MRKLAFAAIGLALFTTVAGVSMGSASAQTTGATVTVKRGDTLSRIAAANGTTYQRLFNANTFIANPDRIYPGQQIRIPASDEQLPNRGATTAAAPAVVPVRQAAPKAAPAAAASGSVWDRIAACESSGNWSINTGNGFYGGLQFTLSSWQLVGGTGLPNNASREEQIARAEKLQAIQGWKAWPVCSLKAGMSY